MPPEITPAPNAPEAPKPTKLQIAEARIAELEAKLEPYLRADELEKARDAERERGRVENAPPRLLGTIPVFDLDEPADVLSRARAIRRGQIPIDRARRFKTEALVMISKSSKLAKRLKTHEPPIGAEFDRDELSAEDIAGLVQAGGIVAIA